MAKKKKPLIKYGLRDAVNDLKISAERDAQEKASQRLMGELQLPTSSFTLPPSSAISEVATNIVPGTHEVPATHRATQEPGSALEPGARQEYGSSLNLETRLEPGARQGLTPAPEGYTKIPNSVFDSLLPTLTVVEQAVYLRLYRLSHGFRQETCKIGLPRLAEACHLSSRGVQKALVVLRQRGLIEVQAHTLGGLQRGTTYKVHRLEQRSSHEQGARQEQNSWQERRSTNTIDDDDSNSKDLHQSETMRIYQSITKNEWKPNDRAAYEKVKGVPLETIEQAIRSTNERAPNRPNSLAYFVKEILNQANPSEQSRAQKKNALKMIVEAVRAIHVGEQGYTFPDFVEDVKRRCARDSVAFDNDLFNEIVD